MNKIYEMMPDLQGDEMILLQNLTKDYSDDRSATLPICIGLAGKTPK